MSDSYILLWLEAPLQSWGHDSKFGRRDSLDFPTKSGVLGLLCCAKGAAGKQTDWLKIWADLDMQVVAYLPVHERAQTLVRQPLLRDFHMVGSGYDDRDPWASLLIPKTSHGKKAVGGGTKITYRYYLQDMAYAVLLQGTETELNNVAQALQAPVWDLYLGRKNCVPTEFIFQGIYTSTEKALEKAQQLAEEKHRKAAFQVLQGVHGDEVLTLNDVPIQFGENKQYRDRRVTVVNLE